MNRPSKKSGNIFFQWKQLFVEVKEMRRLFNKTQIPICFERSELGTSAPPDSNATNREIFFRGDLEIQNPAKSFIAFMLYSIWRMHSPSNKTHMEVSGMKMKDVQKIAKQKGIDAGKMNQTDLIRAIQKAEGNNPCFATSAVQTCGQKNCLWSADCR
jgi:hypothetical protein